MIKAIIIDDEQHCTDRLSRLLEQQNGFIKIIGNYSTANAGIKAIEQLKPDLVFLDIQLKNCTGFELLKTLKKINFQIIFTTAYDKYAIRAIKFSAFDYLLKPIDKKELDQTLQRLKQIDINSNSTKKVHTLLYNSTYTNKKLTIVTEKETYFLLIEDIVHCEADGSYTHLYLKNKTHITASKTLKYFDELLSDTFFFRTHQSHLINMNYVVKYVTRKTAYVEIIDGLRIPIAKRRKELFLKTINS